MFLEVLKQSNWLDIFVVIILFRTSYISIKNGISVELFKLLGTLFACFISLHYFTNLADFFQARIPTPPSIPLEIWDFFSFLLLAILGYLVLVVLRETFFRFIKTEAITMLNKWGAAVLGIARGFILVSLVIFLLSIPVIDYFGNSVREAFFGRHLVKVSIGTYSYFWHSLVSKFMPRSEFNKAVLEIQEETIE